jgi:hypothetical protein
LSCGGALRERKWPAAREDVEETSSRCRRRHHLKVSQIRVSFFFGGGRGGGERRARSIEARDVRVCVRFICKRAEASARGNTPSHERARVRALMLSLGRPPSSPPPPRLTFSPARAPPRAPPRRSNRPVHASLAPPLTAS